jgi:hypothetical protein
VTLIRLTHANNKQVLYIAKDLIAGFYHSAASACTHIVATGGAVFPATESVETIKGLLTDAPKPETKEGA